MVYIFRLCLLLWGAVAIQRLPAARAAIYTLDGTHSFVVFRVRHMTISNVHGRFQQLQGTLDFNEQDITKSKVEIIIEAASISTGFAKRDEDLRSEAFLAAAQYPHITFKSTRIEPVPKKEQWMIVGNLTLHGKTQKIEIYATPPTKPIQDLKSFWRIAVSGATKINRQAFDIVFAQKLAGGEALVGDIIDIQLDTEWFREDDSGVAPKPASPAEKAKD
jgi:polyisoprenoid-binding protein YceI